MSDKLKPCPLCGFNNIHYYGYEDKCMIWVIKCGTCNLTLKNHNKEILKEIWNMRNKKKRKEFLENGNDN